ncbi:MAG: endonuclease III domain-containing protein [Candidatus Hydrogenedentes bacterium]|nr:endonuclease III domain-containing protein [Candidatus Hydrogenedentota bacterium]
MPRGVRRALEEMYERLTAHFGPTHWWPGDTPFEIAVGAILTQNTAWTNVEKAIANLKRARKLSPKAILDCDDALLHDLLRPSGYFRVKSSRLRSFCRHLVMHYGGSMSRMARRPLEELRRELLGIAGIGPETADDILLYACDKPVFVVDAYTCRILSRHGLVSSSIGYEDLRARFERNLDSDLHMFKEYHGVIVYAGKDFCRRTPKCESCPLAPMLKRGQPLL